MVVCKRSIEDLAGGDEKVLDDHFNCRLCGKSIMEHPSKHPAKSSNDQPTKKDSPKHDVPMSLEIKQEKPIEYARASEEIRSGLLTESETLNVYNSFLPLCGTNCLYITCNLEPICGCHAKTGVCCCIMDHSCIAKESKCFNCKCINSSRNCCVKGRPCLEVDYKTCCFQCGCNTPDHSSQLPCFLTAFSVTVSSLFIILI